LTLAEVDLQARAIAAEIQSIGVAGERVLLLYPPGLAYVPALFGCLYAGAVGVTAFPPAPTGSLARFAALVGDVRPALALTVGSLLPMLQGRFAEEPSLRDLRCLASDLLARGSAQAWREPDLDPESLALLMYTSGSTGNPKGVMLTHANVVYSLDFVARVAGMTPATVYVSWAPLNHSMGSIGGVLQALWAGSQLVAMPPQAFLERPARWLELITRYRGTLSGGPNFAYDLCARRVTPEERQGLDLSSWEVSFDGSEPVRKETIDRFSATFASCGFRPEAFFAGYGLTETANIVCGGPREIRPVTVTINREPLAHNRVELTPAVGKGTLTFVGHCLFPDNEVLTVNPETLTLAGDGEVGEIWLGGPVVAQGYWNRPQETAQTFAGFLAGGEGPYLRTGDLGFIHDGYLYITGRLKDLIIIRGCNHYPQDIEQTAGEAHPALRAGAGAAFSVEADGEERLVVVREGDPATGNLDGVVAAVRQAVAAEHELRPLAVLLVKPGTIPRTPGGKIQRTACRGLFLGGKFEVVAEWRDSPAAAAGGPGPDAGGAAQADPDVEIWLLTQLARLLKVAPRELSFSEPLAGYGLDSLMASELVARIRETFQVDTPIRRLFEGATMASLAEDISSARRAGARPSQPAPVPVEGAGDPLLSFAQQRMWFLAQLTPGSPYYNIPGVLRLGGRLDIAALEASLNEIVRRHETLRTTFVSLQGEPKQVIASSREVGLGRVDTTEAEAPGLINEEVKRPFDLSTGPLLRATLFRLGPEDHFLVLTMHHIVCDGWSHNVLLRELVALYEAFAAGRPSPLVALPIQYRDFAHWQRQWLAGEVLKDQLDYWTKRLSGIPPLLDLPSDRPRPPVLSYQGSYRTFEWPADLGARVGALGRREGATLFMTLLAGLKAVLYRYTGQDDIVVGSPVANRTHTETEGLIGFFVNTLVLRTDLSGTPSFRELVRRVRDSTVGALAHQDLPFEKLVEALQPERNLSFTPLFQVAFAFDNAPLGTVKAGNLTLSPAWGETGTTQFDLTLRVMDDSRGLRGMLEYNSDLFDADRIDRLLIHLENLLAQAVALPDRPLGELPLLSVEERNLVLRDWNDTETGPRPEVCLHELFERQAAQTPEAVAVTFRDQRLTYRELDERAGKLALYLRGLGVGPDVPVAIAVERSLEMIIGLYGILKAGGAYVPLDPTYPRERLAYMLEDAHTPVVLTLAKFRVRLPEKDGLRVIRLDEDWEEIAQSPGPGRAQAPRPDRAQAPGPGPGNLAYIIYTSGSTGQPKGAAIPHRGIVNRILWMQEAYGLTPSDRILQKTPYTFDVSVWELFWPLATGARLVVARPGGHQDPAYLKKTIVEEGITTIHFVPSMLQVFLGEPGLSACGSLKRVICSGEALTLAQEEAFFSHLGAGNLGAGNLGVELHNLYGPTEASVDVTSWACEPGGPRREAPIGRPIANTQIYLLDANFELSPVGVPGELYIGGVSLARGYVGRPELTAERFLPDPHGPVPGARLYRTGDLARYRADGAIDFLGRKDFQVKVRGFRVELGEIETVLGSHSSVGQTVVVAREDVPDDKRLVAYVVPTPGAAIRPDRLRAFLKEKLPEYMVPSAFVALERLPLSPNGKMDRRALPVPGESRPPAKVFIAPRTRAEELLSGIFGQVLRLKRVSVEDDFFDLGGHSLLATGVVARIRDAFGIELPVRSLFEAPSVAQLAALVARALETRAGTDLGQVLAQVEQLSDEEVAKMLAVSKERKPGDA